jgi:protease-4
LVSVVTDRGAAAIRTAAVLLGAVLAVVIGWAVFVQLPNGNLTRLLGILLVVGVGVLGARFAARLAASAVGGYDVAEITVSGPISRDGGRAIPSSPMGTPADDIVEQIERADDDRNVDALIVKCNTPGGEVVPSDDIRRAAADFDGPTVAYATDVCASGGYWIASGCDSIFAREGSIVGSIGVIGSRINASELAEKVGLSYERLAAGRFKDAGMSLKEMDEEEREYLQGIIDGFYDDFVERVTEGRDGLSPAEVRDTEARVYLGEGARELGLVDELGTRDDVEAHLADELGVEAVTVREFEPPRRLRLQLLGGAQQIAYSFGAGLASVIGAEDAEGFKVELR